MIVKTVSIRYNYAMAVKDLQDLLERVNNLIRVEIRAVGVKYGLQPVQIEALTYLTQCNRYSDTPQAVTEYLGLTKGTVSQSLKVLEQKGLIKKRKDSQDKRIVHLAPTGKGRKLFEQSFPIKSLESSLEKINSVKAAQFEEALRSTLRSMQHHNNRNTFAACHTCRFNQKEKNGYLCGLTQEPLSTQEVQLICREHQYPA